MATKDLPEAVTDQASPENVESISVISDPKEEVRVDSPATSTPVKSVKGKLFSFGFKKKDRDSSATSSVDSQKEVSKSKEFPFGLKKKKSDEGLFSAFVLQPPPMPGRSRASSIADIAIAITSHPKKSVIKSQHEVEKNVFLHPFGRPRNLIDDILMEKHNDSFKSSQYGPSKMVVWIVFTLFMVGLAGAIVIAAENNKMTFSGDEEINSTTTMKSPIES